MKINVDKTIARINKQTKEQKKATKKYAKVLKTIVESSNDDFVIAVKDLSFSELVAVKKFLEMEYVRAEMIVKQLKKTADSERIAEEEIDPTFRETLKILANLESKAGIVEAFKKERGVK